MEPLAGLDGFRMRTAVHHAARLGIGFPGPGADEVGNLEAAFVFAFLVLGCVIIVAQQNLRARSEVQRIGGDEATAVVAHAVNIHIAAEVIVFQQRAAGFHLHAGVDRFAHEIGRQVVCGNGAGRIYAKILFPNLVYVCILATLFGRIVPGIGNRRDKRTCAGAHIAAAVRHKVADVLTPLFAQRVAVLAGLTAVYIEHAESRCAVRIEQASVLVEIRTDHQRRLFNRIFHCQLHRAVRSGIVALPGQSQVTRRGQIHPRSDVDTAIHKEVFVILRRSFRAESQRSCQHGDKQKRLFHIVKV